MTIDSDPDVRFVVINRERVAYRMNGTGVIKILLLHGLAETSRLFWHEFFRHFGDEYTVVAMDLRGYGDSDKPREGYAPADQARLVAAFIDKLHLDQPILLGHSLGGIIATKFAILFPDRLSRLIVYDSPLSRGLRCTLDLAIQLPLKATMISGLILTPWIGRFVFNLRSTETMRAVLESFPVFCDPSLITEDMLREYMRNTYDSVSQSLWQAVILQDLLREADRVLVPTLIIRGAEDTIVPQDWAEKAAAKIPNSQLVVIDNSCHFPLIEQPDQFNLAVSKFLAAGTVKNG